MQWTNDSSAQRAISVFILSFLVLFLQGCLKDQCEGYIEMKAYTPVYLSYDKFREPVEPKGPRALEHPGKIFYKEDHLFINERNKGVHVVDNSDPGSPLKVAFIPLPGNIDIAAKGNYLYADSFVDFVVFDISEPSAPREVVRMEDVFPYNGFQYTPYEGTYVKDVDPSQGVVVDWIKKKVKEKSTCRGRGRADGNYVLVSENSAASDMSASSSKNANPVLSTGGKGGSMARFTVSANYLYSVKGSELTTFDISTPNAPAQVNTTLIDENIETVFSYDEKLFIGSRNGMHIYSIASPSSPEFLSTYEHVRQCDPVVVQGGHAYVTLRTGTNCGGWENVLDVVDISDPYAPEEVASYGMDDPHGLAVTDSSLFLCEGDFGVDSYRLNTPTDLEFKGTRDGFHAYDVIPYEGVMVITGKNGIHQYDHTQGPGQLEFLSTLSLR